MTLSQQLEQHLQAAGTGPAKLCAQDGQESAVVDLVAIGTLGVSANLVQVKSKRLDAATPDKLREVANALAKHVSYLLEAIAPVEVDDQACTIQMRSTPPYRAENATSYYEILVTAGCIALKRYKKTKSKVRQSESYDITRQVLGRLVDDFVAAANH